MKGMQTRKQYAEQQRLEKEFRMTLEDDLEDLQGLFLPRPKQPSRRRKAIAKKRIRVNQKIKPLHLEQILRLRYVEKLSYMKIGKQLRMTDMTVYSALKRYESQGGMLLDGRKYNGHKNPLHKITPALARAMLDRDLLQQWSGLNLQQRCILLANDFGLQLSQMGLQKFYKRNNVRYLTVGYIYQQGLSRPPSAIEKFVVQLAKLTREGQPLIYFDEASFNLWLRNRRTWTPKVMPIKMVLNKSRGTGVTVFGAISVSMNKPLFTLEVSTNSVAFRNFLILLRKRFKDKKQRLTMVLDNARAHITIAVKEEAEFQNIELMFMPPYTPELNSIEALWSVIKRDFKKRILARKDVFISQEDFRAHLQESCDAISPIVQKHAARYNNRDYIYQVLGRLLNNSQPFVAAETLEAEAASDNSLEVQQAEDDMLEEMMDGSPQRQGSPPQLLSPSNILRKPQDRVFCIDEEEMEAARQYYSPCGSDPEL